MKTLPSRRVGAALVEFAFVAPILLGFFYAMIELSRVLLLKHSVDTAAYEGARHAMVPGATPEEAIAAANQLLTATNLKNAIVTIEPAVIVESTSLITVRVELPMASNSWITPFWFRKGTVVSEVSLITERPPMIQLTGVPKLKAKKASAGSKSSL